MDAKPKRAAGAAAPQGTLREQLAQQAGKAPPTVIEAITAAQADVEESGVAPGLNVGDIAPDFTLPDATGQPVKLSERLKEGPVVLSFYRGEWCPYCNIEIHALQEALPELRAHSANLIVISPQRPDDALTLSEKHRLEFDVLSDTDQEVIRAFRVQYRVPEAVRKISLEVMKNDVSQKNADGTWNLPVPATLVIDRHGVVRARQVSTNYMMSRMEPSEIVEALKEIGTQVVTTNAR
jgi:peroxiredoxin